MWSTPGQAQDSHPPRLALQGGARSSCLGGAISLSSGWVGTRGKERSGSTLAVLEPGLL